MYGYDQIIWWEEAWAHTTACPKEKVEIPVTIKVSTDAKVKVETTVGLSGGEGFKWDVKSSVSSEIGSSESIEIGIKVSWDKPDDVVYKIMLWQKMNTIVRYRVMGAKNFSEEGRVTFRMRETMTVICSQPCKVKNKGTVGACDVPLNGTLTPIAIAYG